MNIKLFAGLENTLDINASHFRVTDSSAPIKATFEGGERSQPVNLERGMAFSPLGGYTRVRLVSDSDQLISIETTLGALDDNRISGTVNVFINSLEGVKSSRESVNETPKQITTLNTDRNRLIIKNAGSEPAYIGSSDVDVTGFEIAAGEKEELNRAAAAQLFAVSTATGTNLHLLAEYKTQPADAVQIPDNALLTESGAALTTNNGEYITI